MHSVESFVFIFFSFFFNTCFIYQTSKLYKSVSPVIHKGQGGGDGAASQQQRLTLMQHSSLPKNTSRELETARPEAATASLCEVVTSLARSDAGTF